MPCLNQNCYWVFTCFLLIFEENKFVILKKSYLYCIWIKIARSVPFQVLTLEKKLET
jgi:hypothetical protein